MSNVNDKNDLKNIFIDALKAASDLQVHRNDATIILTLAAEGVWIALYRGRHGQWDRLVSWLTLELSNLPNPLIHEMQDMIAQIDAILPA
jgi:hypothetical protein